MNQLLAALDGVKRKGRDKYVALCPVHSEKTPSLNIKMADDGSVLAHCFGCGANGYEVYKALGLDLEELFGGKKLESDYVPNEIRDTYNLDKIVAMIYECMVKKNQYISLKDKRRYRVAVSRIEGLEKKYPRLIC